MLLCVLSSLVYVDARTTCTEIVSMSATGADRSSSMSCTRKSARVCVVVAFFCDSASNAQQERSTTSATNMLRVSPACDRPEVSVRDNGQGRVKGK